MKRMKPFGVFFLSMVGYILLAYLVFPVENDSWQVPDYYLVVSVITSSAFTVLYNRWQKRRKPKHLPSAPLVVSDELLDAAANTIITTGQASVSMLQRRLGISYTRGTELMSLLERIGIVGPFNGKTPRRILMTETEYKQYKSSLFVLVPASGESDFCQERMIDAAVAHAETEQQYDFSKYGGVEADLLTIDLMEGHDFEYWSANLLRDLGFINVEVTKGSGDQGVDVLAEKDGIRYAIQCKCYRSSLGNTPIQEVHAGKKIYNCQIGAVITNQYFTSGGKELAEKTGTLLWDRAWLREAINRRNSKK